MANVVSKHGDILQTEAEALVNTVNCVGVMGRGIALQFKKAFPKNFTDYKSACDDGEVVPGRMFVHQRHALDLPRFIINFPTKRHWRGKSRIEDIKSGLEDLYNVIRENNIQSIAIPPLGSGLGGLNWMDVRPLIIEALGDIENLELILHDPGHTPKAKDMAVGRDVPNMTDGRAALVMMIKTYIDGLMEPYTSLLEVHKLMYFLQAVGQPLRLQYKAHHRGPYASNLRHVLTKIEGHMVSGYADGGDQPDKALEIVPGALEDARGFLANKPEVQDRIDRVRDLVAGYESQYALELLASVHWLVHDNKTTDVESITQALHQWTPRKAQLYGERQVSTALNTLKSKGWIQDGEILEQA